METTEKIVGRECKFVTYCKPNDYGDQDLHVIKEVIHYEDGRKVPNVRLAYNYQRTFGITKKGRRTHKQKKEWANLDDLNLYKTTQSRLIDSIAKAIDEPYYRGDLRKLCRNPYIYGTDILSTALIKAEYQKKYNNLFCIYRIAVLDTETDMLHGTGQIIMATLSMGSSVTTRATKDFFEGVANVEEKVQKKLVELLEDEVKTRNIVLDFKLVDEEIYIVRDILKKAHELKPDFVVMWNMLFDLGKIEAAILRKGLRVEDFYSDPSVPHEYRFYRLKEGPKTKITASGVFKALKPAERWHTVYTPSSFYLADAMCVYKQVRTGSQEEPSYSLDDILFKELERRKLKFEEADGFEKGEWHTFMQQNYKVEYTIYNIFDCISIELLDEKTNDLRLTMPMFCGCSDFENFKSQPRRAVDRLHNFCLALNPPKMIASTSDEMSDDDDEETLSLRGWITTLPAHLIMDNGLRLIAECPDLSSNIRGHTGDLDVSASYPNGGAVLNISKETTLREIIDIPGIPEEIFRMASINLSGGPTNAVEFCQDMFAFPELDLLLSDYKEELERRKNKVIEYEQISYSNVVQV